MKTKWLALVVVCSAVMAGVASAGEPNRLPVPVLGEHGLLALGVGLAAVGLVALRRRRRG